MLFQENKYLKKIVSALASVFFMTASLSAENFEFAAESAKKSVIYISVFEKVNTSGGAKYSKIGYGSGTIIDDDGSIVTNNHVVKGGDYFQAMLYDGTECNFEKVKGKYYISDLATDLSVMKLQKINGIQFVPIPSASSDDLKAGQWVIAIGSPYGLKNSITSGVISSVGRYDVGFTEIEDFIQTDVPINPGNSGGPLVNSDGRMIGINTAIRTVSGGFQGISFAIPSSMVMKVFNDLITYGKVRRGWLGLLVKNEFRESESGNYDVRVVSVITSSPAESSGLREGDIIREINKEIINSKGEMLKIVKNSPVGGTLEVILDRNGKIFIYKVVLVEKNSYMKFGKSIEVILDRYGLEFDFDANKNLVIVTYVSPFRSETHKNMLSPGDVILSVNNKNVKNMETFYNVVENSSYNIYSVEVLRESRKIGIKFNE